MAEIEPIRWRDGHLELLDQRLLPQREKWLTVTGYRQAMDAIRQMAVRGAPAIGVTAAYAMALASQEVQAPSMPEFTARLREIGNEFQSARPTAVNLAWAVTHCLLIASQSASPSEAQEQLLAGAKRMQEADVAANRAMGCHGAELFPESSGVLTHCNTGALATAGWGTALGVIRSAWEQGKRLTVFCTETRPWLQGARLTAWEFVQLGIPAHLIVDSAAGTLMRQGTVHLVVVGADRIAANGDVANKIGTYTLAVLAKEHRVPFYVAAPLSTVDLAVRSGDEIEIEERAPEEVTHWAGKSIAPDGVDVRNPAFDVTPHDYVSAIITEHGVVRPPYLQGLAALGPRRHTEIRT